MERTFRINTVDSGTGKSISQNYKYANPNATDTDFVTGATAVIGLTLDTYVNCELIDTRKLELQP